MTSTTNHHRPNIALLVMTLLCILAVYTQFTYLGIQRQSTDLYAKLGQAFLQGHTYLNKTPPAGLATLSDPYDPAQNARYIWQDVSYFNHKFYVYFGPTPALVWAGIYKLTGLYLQDGAVGGMLAGMGMMALIILLYRVSIRQQIFHEIGFAFVALSVAFGTHILFILGRPLFYETAIAGAFCFSSLGALFLWFFLEKRNHLWLGIASLCLGAAVASRIIHGANGLLLVAAVIYVAYNSKDKKSLYKTLAACLPYAICLGAVGIYNYVRFGNPFDIGWRYVLTTLGNMHAPDFNPMRPDTFLVNSYVYLIKPLIFSGSWEFPFYTRTSLSVPWNHSLPWYQEMTLGLWTNSPFALFYPLFLCHLNAVKTWLPQTRTLTYGLIAYNLVIFIFLLFYFFLTQRFLVDFAPMMMALGGLYYLHLLKTLPHRQTLLLVVGGLLAAYSVFTSVTVGYCGYECWPKLPA